ncbi:hypothetical protein [Lewinella sp. W8]|nr:hypothetical protein [Lewinella sp. W8]
MLLRSAILCSFGKQLAPALRAQMEFNPKQILTVEHGKSLP